MRHSPITSHDSQIARQQDVEYIVLPEFENTKAKNFWDYIHILRKRKWLVITPLLIIFPLAILYIFEKKPIYETSATLLIDKVNPNVIAIEEVISPEYSSDSPDFFRTQYELIRSPLVLEEVVDAFQLAEPLEAEKSVIGRVRDTVRHLLRTILASISTSYSLFSSFTPAEKTLSDAELVDAELVEKTLSDAESAEKILSDTESAEKILSDAELRQDAVEKLQNRLEIKPKTGTLLVDIILRGVDRVSIIQQVNRIAEVYMQQNLENKMDASKKAVFWLTQREEELKKKIGSLEAKLQIYKENKKIAYFDQLENYENPTVKNINSLQSSVMSLTVEKEKLDNEIRSIKSLSKKDIESMLGALPNILNSSFINSLKGRYAELSVQHHNLSKIYGKKHPDILRINSQISELADLVQEEINKQLYAMENEYRKLVSLEKSYDRKLEEQKKDFIHLSNDIQKYNELKSELGIDKEMLLTVSKRLAETTLTEALETNNIRMVRMASVSVEANPHLKEKIAVISLLTSLGLGVGLGLIMENFDKRFRSVDEAEQYLGIAFLGIVPGYKVRGNKLVALYNPDASASEAYRTVRTWIRLSSQGGIKTLLITSALAGEGKSQTAGNLAVSFAQLGQKVLLIDADFRRPQLHRTFNLVNSAGLVDVLVHGTEWPSVLHDTAMENLQVLTTGGRPHNPTELLSMVRMQNLLANAKDTFDLVIVDAPVMLTIPDVAILIPDMDGVLLVHDPSKGAREVVLEAKKLLDRAGANLLGMIFNNVSVKRQMHYQHTSEYYQNTYNQLGQQRRRKKSDMSFVDMRPTEGQEREEKDA